MSHALPVLAEVCSPCWGDGGEHTGCCVYGLMPSPAAALAAAAFSVPTNSEPIPVQIPIGQMGRQISVHLALPGVVGLLDDGPVTVLPLGANWRKCGEFYFHDLNGAH